LGDAGIAALDGSAPQETIRKGRVERALADDSASSQNVGAPWRVYCNPFAINIS